MNEHMADMLAWEAKEGTTFRHVHATGSAAYRWLPQMVRDKGVELEKHPNIRLTEYIYDMADQMAAADLIICRAGAATIGELCALGRASIMVPSPYVAENHQKRMRVRWKRQALVRCFWKKKQAAKSCWP